MNKKRQSEEAEKPKRVRKSKEAKLPMSARINDYSFLGFRKRLLDALTWQKEWL